LAAVADLAAAGRGRNRHDGDEHGKASPFSIHRHRFRRKQIPGHVTRANALSRAGIGLARTADEMRANRADLEANRRFFISSVRPSDLGPDPENLRMTQKNSVLWSGSPRDRAANGCATTAAFTWYVTDGIHEREIRPAIRG
jgi:hypothetical protein